jgi:hypothetical protein
MLTVVNGWWKYKEILVCPKKGEILSPSLKVIVVTYTGNSKNSDNDDVWKNWRMQVQVVAPTAAEGIFRRHQ